jgi:hypothetical protein
MSSALCGITRLLESCLNCVFCSCRQRLLLLHQQPAHMPAKPEQKPLPLQRRTAPRTHLTMTRNPTSTPACSCKSEVSWWSDNGNSDRSSSIRSDSVGAKSNVMLGSAVGYSFLLSVCSAEQLGCMLHMLIKPRWRQGRRTSLWLLPKPSARAPCACLMRQPPPSSHPPATLWLDIHCRSATCAPSPRPPTTLSSTCTAPS